MWKGPYMNMHKDWICIKSHLEVLWVWYFVLSIIGGGTLNNYASLYLRCKVLISLISISIREGFGDSNMFLCWNVIYIWELGMLNGECGSISTTWLNFFWNILQTSKTYWKNILWYMANNISWCEIIFYHVDGWMIIMEEQNKMDEKLKWMNTTCSQPRVIC